MEKLPGIRLCKAEEDTFGSLVGSNKAMSPLSCGLPVTGCADVKEERCVIERGT
jgi:hypothetical protein